MARDKKEVIHRTATFGKGGGPIKKLFGELSGGGIFTIKGKRSRVYEKLEAPTTPEGNTAKWFDGRAKGEPVYTFACISDDTEVILGTM
ncbi:MAG: hypothetical protein PHZ04_04420 [Patescibacteria group bacterium]|nr:hypothetical protein [Patescibacteria group bacterium]MDD5294678.1 hypothetical protein [Patescibacteria group bacterium]MDD5554845.1 hypothetical protein [Patescibacteria group bacterium]